MAQPLTQEQFQKARNAGFSTDQIIEFEKKRLSGEPETITSVNRISILPQLGQSFKTIGVGLLGGIVNPPYRVAAHTLQGLESIVRGGKATTYRNPITGDIVEPYTKETKLSKPIGLGLQTAALGLSPGLGGLMYGAGGALEEEKSPSEVVRRGLLGAGFGKVIGMLMGERLLTGRVGKFISKKIQFASKESSARIVNSLIKPLLKDFSYGKNPGLAIAEEGIVANNLDDLAQKITQHRQQVGQRIKTVLSQPKNAKRTINLSDSLKPIDDAILKAQEAPLTNKSVIARLGELKDDILGTNVEAGTFKGRFPLYTNKITLADATDLKRKVGDLTRWTGNLSDDKIVNKALKEVYGGIKEKIGNALPEIKPLNETYANLISAEIATKYRDKIMQRQNLIGLAPKLLGGGAAIMGLASGNYKLIIAGIAELGMDKILSSPALKTRLASGLAKLSKNDLLKVGESYPLLMRIMKK